MTTDTRHPSVDQRIELLRVVGQQVAESLTELGRCGKPITLKAETSVLHDVICKYDEIINRHDQQKRHRESDQGKASAFALALQEFNSSDMFDVPDELHDTVVKYFILPCLSFSMMCAILRIKIGEIPLRVEADILQCFMRREGISFRWLTLLAGTLQEAYGEPRNRRD